MHTDHTSHALRADIGLAVVRAGAGAVFAAHGFQKLFIYGISGVTGAFGQMGVPLPQIAGPLTGAVKLLGGLALITGLLTRVAGAGLAVTMLGAIGFAHLAGGFFAPNGIEFPLVLLASTAALAVAGAGRYSLDALFAARRARPATTDVSTHAVRQVA